MRARLLFAVLLPMLVLTIGLRVAYADTYTWTDAAGRVNVSNLPPPEGSRVTNVVHESAPKGTPPSDSYREAARQAEVLALADRVRQLEREAEIARYTPPPQYAVAPPPVQYAPPPVQYAYAPPPAQYEVAPQASAECDPAHTNCGPFGIINSYYNPYFNAYGNPYINPYPASVIVVRAPNFRRPHPGHGGGRNPALPPRPPMHAASGLNPLRLR
jgi:hypothetical protein